MSRILVISPVPTHPADAGNRARVHVLTRTLRESGHDVYFMHVQFERGDIEAMRTTWGDRYVPIEYARPQSGARKLFRRVGRKLGWERAYRYGIDEWYDPALDDAIDAFNGRVDVDAVLVEYVFMSRALLRFSSDVLKVIDTHDVFSNRHVRYLSHNQAPAWFSCSPSEESRGLDRADTVLAIQEDEAADLRARTARRVVTVGHAVELRALPESDIVPGRILSVGSANRINVRSLEWFVAEVLPRIRQQHPAAELAVAGTICRRIQALSGIRLLGRLEDLSQAYATAQVVVNPMQFGTGLKIKTLEALGHGRALVTTPCGAAGLTQAAGDAFMVGSDAVSFAAEVVRLLADMGRSLALGEAGYRFAASYNQSVETCLTGLFGRRRRT
jgi:glycosyltransferase involved in cell wall biosynthesis